MSLIFALYSRSPVGLCWEMREGGGEKMASFRQGPRYILWQVSDEGAAAGRDGSASNDSTASRAGRGSRKSGGKGPLGTDEAVKFIDSVARHYKSTIIFSGGEPFEREDIFDLAEYASARGLRVLVRSNLSRFDADIARKCVESRIRGIQVNLDGSSARAHDGFRGEEGSFIRAIKGIELVRLAGLKLEIYSFVTRRTVEELPKINVLAQKLGAWGHNIFFVVPCGPLSDMEGEQLEVEEYQKWLNWMFERKYRLRMNIKPICSPQFNRILWQRADELPDHLNPRKTVAARESIGPGCPAAKLVCFVAANGDVTPCEWLPDLVVGNVRKRSFKGIWERSAIFKQFRDPSLLQDKCGRCGYAEVCGGCRALAYEESGDFLAADPYCPYEPEAE